MTSNVNISDSRGGGYKAAVDEHNSLHVTDGAFRPREKIYALPFIQYLTTNGAASGTSEMAITTGTLANPVKYYITASQTRERYITSLSFMISAAAADLSEFGTGAALTNGCRLVYSGDRIGETVIDGNLKLNYEFIRLCDGKPAPGTGGESFRWNGTPIEAQQSYIPVLDLKEIAPPYGLKLERFTDDSIIMEIRDNTLTGRAVNFNVIAKGFEVI